MRGMYLASFPIILLAVIAAWVVDIHLFWQLAITVMAIVAIWTNRDLLRRNTESQRDIKGGS